jgi:hypothetical protein
MGRKGEPKWLGPSLTPNAQYAPERTRAPVALLGSQIGHDGDSIQWPSATQPLGLRLGVCFSARSVDAATTFVFSINVDELGDLAHIRTGSR